MIFALRFGVPVAEVTVVGNATSAGWYFDSDSRYIAELPPW